MWLAMALFGGALGAMGCESPSAFQTRGVVITPADLTLKEWPALAAKAGLTTIGLHPFPSTAANFIESDDGKVFLEQCARLGLNIEYELHCMRSLLPRSLFAKEPDCFRMNEQGERTSDANLCVHSQRALDVAAANAVQIARKLKPTTGRYFFWGDDMKGWCRCPKCREYSDSDQALIVENRLIRALRTIDPNAQLAHLAYRGTLEAPRKVKPEPGIFLEFAPIQRRYTESVVQPSNSDCLRALKENLKVFPVETAQVLEYWLDVSKFSGKQAIDQLPWRPAVMAADARGYARFGIRHITTFAVRINADYVSRYGVPSALQEYGDYLRSTAIPAVTKSYSVTQIPQDRIQLDGRLDEPEWKQASVEIGFSLPWESADVPRTVFRALLDQEWFYFAFEAHDNTPVVEESLSNKLTVAKEDRVELFFAPDDSLSKYYCLEIDPVGRILDYAASFHRNFDYSWKWPTGVPVATTRTETGYVVEGRIQLATLESLGISSLRKGQAMKVGAFRADFRRRADGKVEEHWISWIDPETAEPDFHTHTAFGVFKIGDVTR